MSPSQAFHISSHAAILGTPYSFRFSLAGTSTPSIRLALSRVAGNHMRGFSTR